MLIDLKNTSIFFEDGSMLTGAVNLMAGYTAGATSIAVNGFTGTVPVGARLSLAGDDRYQVVSTTQTSGNTTQITFSPGLNAATLVNAAAVIAYGVFVKIKIGEGTISWTEKQQREYKLDRGLIDEVRNGDQVPMDVSMDFQYEYLLASSTDTAPSPEDVLKRRGLAASWVSSDTNNTCAPFSINIRLDHQPPNCPAVQVERVILPFFRYEELQYAPKEGKVSCSGKCNAVEPVVTRFARLGV